MKYISFIIVLALNVLASEGFAATEAQKEAACFCEIGDKPTNEQKYFKWGCHFWFKRQSNCAVLEIVPQNSNYSEKLRDLKQSGIKVTSLNVGYVGHWDNSRRLISYLNQRIVPVMNEFNVSASVDNTACRAMEDLFEVKNYLDSIIIPRDSVLRVKGNQVLSIGVWDVILGKSANLGAVVRKYSANEADIQYPLCKHFENQPCLGVYQERDQGYCIEGDKKHPLTCVRAHERTAIPDPNLKASDMKKFVWKKQW